MIYKKIKQFITELEESGRDMRTAVSFSGGTDSRVLLDVFIRLWKDNVIPEPEVIYFNHKLRGKESAAEEKFVKETCAACKIKLRLIHLEVKKYAEEKKMTIETAARELRYFHYGRLAEDYGCIAQGHHADDNAETVFFNIMRGSGLEGACGIKKVRDKFIRPLLDFTRREILDYAADRNLKFVEDSTNAKTDHSRNKIRNIIFPLIEKELNREIKNSINNFSSSLREAKDHIDKETEKISKRLLRSSEGISIIKLDGFNSLDPCLRTAVFRTALRKAGFTYSPDMAKTGKMLERISQKSRSETGTGDMSVTVSRNSIIILNKNIFGNKTVITVSSDKFSDHYIDIGKTKGNIKASKVKSGETFTPFGKNKAEKISKVLSDKKIPVFLRKDIMCLKDDEKVIFVQGCGISELVKTDKGTKETLYINVSKDILRKMYS
ncbi:MAG: tRNA lysidine(34) synthetase TilS [Candidatus Delongbacteria bacterium]|nr:tRNA lysidine(34) synthetase TilS [Candidatus Delongbacteria bacterium]